MLQFGAVSGFQCCTGRFFRLRDKSIFACGGPNQIMRKVQPAWTTFSHVFADLSNLPECFYLDVVMFWLVWCVEFFSQCAPVVGQCLLSAMCLLNMGPFLSQQFSGATFFRSPHTSCLSWVEAAWHRKKFSTYMLEYFDRFHNSMMGVHSRSREASCGETVAKTVFSESPFLLCHLEVSPLKPHPVLPFLDCLDFLG